MNSHAETRRTRRNHGTDRIRIQTGIPEHARTEAQQLNGDILGTQHLGLAGEARLGTDADDGIEPLVFLAGNLGQALAAFLHVDVAGTAFGLPLAFVQDAHLRTQKRGQQGRPLRHVDGFSRRQHSQCRHLFSPRCC